MAAINGFAEKVKKAVQQEVQKNNNSSKSSETSSSKASGSSSYNSSYYDDNSKMSVSDAYSKVLGSSIFADDNVGCYRSRMEKAITNLENNDKWTITVDDDGDGEFETKKLIDAIADSFDCELDLYIQDKLEEVMKKYGHCSKGYLSEKALAELKSYGIVAEAIGSDDKNTNRVYAFSLVDENGNVLEQDGKKGSIIFGDCLIPDGYAQGAETQLSSILDLMGYDCVSKADFIGREGEYAAKLKEVEANIQAGLYEGKGGTDTLYSNRKDITTAIKQLWGGNGSAPGYSSVGGDGEVGADGLTEEQRTEMQKNQDDAKKEYDKLLNQKITEYKNKHNGAEPTGNERTMIENQVQREISSKYSVEFSNGVIAQ